MSSRVIGLGSPASSAPSVGGSSSFSRVGPTVSSRSVGSLDGTCLSDGAAQEAADRKRTAEQTHHHPPQDDDRPSLGREKIEPVCSLHESRRGQDLSKQKLMRQIEKPPRQPP